ncbi:MAG TPA: glycosyltransferase family 2 protein [Anaerolineae bacterium]|jgi:glycosyltransferase involved in cell wall biosynthesis|nr:glycosyltransferase family 2 protein [Anaerolineae bacterium]
MVKMVSFVIPAYNERAYIGDVIRALDKVALPDGVQRELVVVDDGSTDGTADYLEGMKDIGSLRVHRLAKNGGKGSALREGFRIAQGDVIIVCDADMEYDPNDIPRVLEPILSERADIVYGSRFLGSIGGMKRANRIANRILTATANILFRSRITDEATAYKAFDRRVLNSINLTCTGFEFCPEVTAKTLRRGYKIHEVPIRYAARSVKEGKKIKWQDGFIAIWTLIKYRFIG